MLNDEQLSGSQVCFCYSGMINILQDSAGNLFLLLHIVGVLIRCYIDIVKLVCILHCCLSQKANYPIFVLSKAVQG